MEAKMTGGALRILQVGDLRLDTPLKGDFTAFPSEIQTRILNSKFQAAKNLFAAAVSEQVDFVLLTGAATSSQGGTRPCWFLQKEFDQLAKHGIKVVCVEATDNFWWSENVRLPENVHILTRSQSIGFRITNCDSPIEIEWESSQSSEDYDSRIGLNLRLNEIGGRVSTVNYSAHESQTSETVEVNFPQAESSLERGPFDAKFVQMSPLDGIQYSTISSQTLRWETIDLDIVANDHPASIQEKINNALHSYAETQNHRATSDLITVCLRPNQAQSLSVSPDLLRTILAKSQNRAMEQGLTSLPIRIETPDPLNQNQNDLPVAMKVAMDELATIQLEDVYENLDLHALDFAENSIERTKQLAARRLANLLNDTCL